MLICSLFALHDTLAEGHLPARSALTVDVVMDTLLRIKAVLFCEVRVASADLSARNMPIPLSLVPLFTAGRALHCEHWMGNACSQLQLLSGSCCVGTFWHVETWLYIMKPVGRGRSIDRSPGEEHLRHFDSTPTGIFADRTDSMCPLQLQWH